MKLSNITAGLTGQPMFQMMTRVREMEIAGKNIIHFEIGDSAYEADPFIVSLPFQRGIQEEYDN